METTHHRYYDYGYSDWQCIECDNSTDYCDADNKVKLDNQTGAAIAGRWTTGTPGKAA